MICRVQKKKNIYFLCIENKDREDLYQHDNSGYFGVKR